MSDDNLEDSLRHKESHYVNDDVDDEGKEEEEHSEELKHCDDEYGFHGGEEEEEEEATEGSYYATWRDDEDETEDGAKAVSFKETTRDDAGTLDKSTLALELEPGFSYGSFDSRLGAEAAVQRFSVALGIPGVVRLSLSALTQKIIGCVIDEHVTTEYPWLYVRKEIIEDNLDLHPESSDFLPVKDEIERHPLPEILMGYAPTVRDVGQFYVCLTEESRRLVEQSIDELRREQQERVRKSVIKEPGPWQHLGSADLIDQTFVKTSRALFEVELKVTAEQLKAPTRLADRDSADQRDGYVGLTADREMFSNVERVLVDRGSKAIPKIKTSDAQTETAMLVNTWSQCGLDKEPSAEHTCTDKKSQKELEKFIKSKVEDVCREVHSNTTWDVYANDYAKLAKPSGERVVAEGAAGPTTEFSSGSGYVERQMYYEGNLCRGRVINDLSWHPQWTGVAAVVYTPTGKSENLIGRKPPDKVFAGDDQVLVWSFDDCLRPKLVLEAKRLVTSVCFCPHNGNVVVGGCKNGQIVIWDITGKIEEVERIVIRTATQVKHNAVVKSLTTWMKEPRDSSVVRPTATSDLQSGQKDAITKIEWLSPYRKIDKRGAVHDLPADTPEANLSNQFVTSSEDGSVAFWDLSLAELEEKKREEEEKARRKKRKSVQKPQALKESISAYKFLDGTYKPIYMIIVVDPVTARNVIVSAVSARYPNFKKLQVSAAPRSSELAERRYYRAQMEKVEDESLPNGLFVATAMGECGFVVWEGFDFSTGISVNKEVAKWSWRRQLHDGPVSHAVRSRHLQDLVLTVGGNIFAVWRDDFDEPVLWRRSDSRYTSCCWDADMPSVMLLGRNDGTVEIWNLFVKSHEPHVVESLSGRIITGIYAHELPMSPQCIGLCDYNGALRIFLAPMVSSETARGNANWMRQFVTREVDRINNFKAWHKKWIELTAVEEQTSDKQAVKKADVLVEDKQMGQLAEEAAKMDALRKTKAKKRKQLIEEMRERWVTRELERMERTILTKKGLREEELERRQEPVLRMKREAEEKEERRRRVIERAPELFEEAVASNFPHHKEKLLTAFTLPSDRRLDSVLTIENAVGDHKTEEEEIIEDYERIEAEALALVQSRSQTSELEFSWRKVIEAGIRRRRSLDINLKPHKIKFKDSVPASLATDVAFSLPEDDEDSTGGSRQ